MTKEAFKALFEDALEVAAENAEKKLGRPVPRSFDIEMHGLAHHPSILDKHEALEAIYLGPDRFYCIIDLSVIRVSKDSCTVFMCISGHEPSALKRTWDQPTGSGPFKQLLPLRIELI